MWENDLAAIRKRGFSLIRTFSSWNWMEPEPGEYELTDFDRLFELAERNGLKVVFDFTLSTHMACPDWLVREHPDIRVVYHTGEAAESFANSAGAQGGNRHCYDHPAWKEYGGRLIRAVVRRYKDSPALGLWSVWDGPSLPGLGNDVNRPGRSCYCVHTLAKYHRWLKLRFTLEELNERLDRRYRSWDDVEAPRSNELVMAMLLFRQFLHENLADTLRWQIQQVRQLDDKHELHCHGFRFPQPYDEIVAGEADSWGFAAHSTNLLASDDPYALSNIAFASQWSRAIGKKNRWWYDELYSGMYHAGLKYRKQSTPQDLAMNLWLGLAYGAKGLMLWQYRTEYATQEAPGLSLVSLGGLPLPRLKAVEETIQSIARLDAHLPLRIPNAEVALVWDSQTATLADMAGGLEDQWCAIRGVHRGFWELNIPVDLVTPAMDWSGYKLIYLPNLMLLDESLIRKIRGVMKNQPHTHVFADGLLGTNSATGRFSYNPPEGLADLIDVQALDYSRIDERDIRDGANVIVTPQGRFKVARATNYVSLLPGSRSRACARYGNEVVGIRARAGLFTWITLTLGTAFGGLPPQARIESDLPYGHALDGVAPKRLLLSLARAAGVQAPVTAQGSKVIVLARRSAAGHILLFIFNLQNSPAKVAVTPRQPIDQAEDLLEKRRIVVRANRISLTLNPHTVKVVRCSPRCGKRSFVAFENLPASARQVKHSRLL